VSSADSISHRLQREVVIGPSHSSSLSAVAKDRELLRHPVHQKLSGGILRMNHVHSWSIAVEGLYEAAPIK
jgi:hypothetical protein